MKSKHILMLSLAAALVGGYAGAKFVSRTVNDRPETAFERVVRTNKLRCGYYVIAPISVRDPNTGHLSGIAMDAMDYFSQKTGIEVEWSEEVTFGNWVPALQSSRFDAMCTPMLADLSYARAALFTKPLFYSAVVPLVRVDDARNAVTSDALNAETVKFAVQEGNMRESLVRRMFPKATRFSLPAHAEFGEVVQAVLTKKADILLWDKNGLIQYSKKNPGKLKILQMDKPISHIPFELATATNAPDLRDLLDQMVSEMQITGEMDRILDRWDGENKTFPRVVVPMKTYAH